MGLGLPGALWSPVAERLPAHELFLPDHAGVGTREAEPPPTSTAALAEDVRRGLDARGWADAHVVGVSLGGMVAQELAVRHPHRVRTLTLVATTAHGLALFARPTRVAVHALLTARERPERLARLLYPPAFRERHAAEVADRTRRMAAAFAPPASARAQLRAVLGHDARNRVATLRMPVTVVAAAHDALIPPRHAEDLARRVPGARLVVFPDAGHGLLHQEAAGLAALLDATFAEGG